MSTTIIANHVMVIEFHQYFMQLLDRFDIFNKYCIKYVDCSSDDLLNQDDITINVVIYNKITKAYETHTINTKLPSIYTDCLDFYIFDTIPIFYPNTGPHGHTSTGVISKNVFLQTTDNNSINWQILYPELVISAEFDDLVSMSWKLPNRNREYKTTIIPGFNTCVLPSSTISYTPTSSPIIKDGLVDLRPICPPVFDQGDLGTCGVATAITLIDIIFRSHFSVMFLYHTVRFISDVPLCYDWGSESHICIDALLKYGVCKSETWPYDPIKFMLKPDTQAFEEAEAMKTELNNGFFLSLETLDDIRLCLTEGRPLALDGCLCGEAYKRSTASTGIFPLPKKGEKISLETNEHAFTLVGYNDAESVYIVMQSWGVTWGDKGFGYLPYKYLQPGLFRSAFTFIKANEVTKLNTDISLRGLKEDSGAGKFTIWD